MTTGPSAQPVGAPGWRTAPAGGGATATLAAVRPCLPDLLMFVK